MQYVYKHYELDVGTRVPMEGAVTVAGQRFTQTPAKLGFDGILVIHELAHFQEVNHTDAFWALVAEHDPEYATHGVAQRAQYTADLLA
ncbi:M48 family metallopeptidase [Natronosalvus caseinilyticus]|uniref:M48 metallopeptidase family protein n=1 Tax=Natronosalvus caseinilyticus TaxID=2953747 RepID=UPI0028A68930|nr:M48 family metallopeptidase [Natronosalvus caseinilyticus]